MPSVARLILCLMVALQAASAWAAGHSADSLDQVKEGITQKKAILLDVREKREWDAGHLADAKFFPLSELKKAAADPVVAKKVSDQLPKEKIIYCHCGSGVRVLAVAKILSDLGYDVRPLKDGYADLIDAGFPGAAK